LAYAHGIGVSKNDAEAYTWFLLAAAKGTYLAKEAMTLIEGSMTAEQMAEGQRRAAAYHAKESQ
jgi:TPR repeat protein